MSDDILSIDGSEGEGGGQILRSSLGLALVTGRPFRIHHIRGNRKKPGLRRQHLCCVEAAARVGSAQVSGAELNSLDLFFRPAALVGGEHHISIGTAGSACLVIQAVLPGLLQAPAKTRLVVEGGTHNPMAPTADFLDRSFFDQLRRMGARISLCVERMGFFPAGGGRLVLEVDPAGELKPRDLLAKGKHRGTSAIALVASLPRSIAEREKEVLAARLKLRKNEIRIVDYEGSAGPGNVVTVAAEYDEVHAIETRLGELGLPAERVAGRAAKAMRDYLASPAPVGEYLADQLLIPWALAGGGSFRCGPLSLHATTNISVIERFLPVRFSVLPEPSNSSSPGFRSESSIVRCQALDPKMR